MQVTIPPCKLSCRSLNGFSLYLTLISTPMRLAYESDLDGNMWRLYEYIARHFLGTVSSNCKYKKTKVTFDIGSEVFTCSGKRIMQAGFYDVMPWLRLNETELPDLTGVKSCRVLDVQLKTGQTQAPGYLTESELIGQVRQKAAEELTRHTHFRK